LIEVDVGILNNINNQRFIYIYLTRYNVRVELLHNLLRHENALALMIIYYFNPTSTTLCNISIQHILPVYLEQAGDIGET